MTASPSGKPCRQRASSPASPQAAAERFHIPTTRRSTRSVTRSRTSSPNSRTGGASRRATTDVRILSSQQYASPLPLSSGFDLTSPEPRAFHCQMEHLTAMKMRKNNGLEQGSDPLRGTTQPRPPEHIAARLVQNILGYISQESEFLLPVNISAIEQDAVICIDKNTGDARDG